MITPQLLLERDRLQAFHAIFKRYFLVNFPEEARVFESCAENLLVAVLDGGFALFIHLDVEHGEEVRQQLAVRTLDSEVLLVVAHHGDQHFFRQRQILGLEVTKNHSRPLGQMNDGFNQRLVLAPARSGNSARCRIESLANDTAALDHIDHGKGLPQRFGVALR